MHVIPSTIHGEVLTHTMSSGGRDVIAAGHIRFGSNGQVLRFDNMSGHYRPGESQTRQIVEALLREAGLR